MNESSLTAAETESEDPPRTCLIGTGRLRTETPYRFGLFKITNAAITPGTHPQSHNKKTITIEPHPRSRTAKGGQKIERMTLQILMILMIFND